MNIIGGLIGVLVGFLVVKYSVKITNTLGSVDFAERYLPTGSGGTYGFYKLLGILIIILSFLYMFGLLGGALGPLGSVFKAGQAPR